MVDGLIAKRYINNINTGISRPFIVECLDNKAYVIKYLGNNQSNKILVNDLICCRLADHVGIKVPKVGIVHIPEMLIEIEKELQNIRLLPGKHFGSLYYKNTVSFTGENSLKGVSNKNQIPKIIAFDFWVGNDDRTDNLGNLLIGTSKNKNDLITIDYGNAFNGPDWIEDDLIFDDINIIPIDGKVYSCLFKEIKNINCFDEICTDIESLNMNDIEKLTIDIPKEWGLSECHRELICEFLFNRKYKIRDTMKYIIEEKLKL